MKNQSLPFVSVIVPAFNEEKYILQLLHALIRQDYPCYEIIITDNASTDHTALLVHQFMEMNGSNKTAITLLYEQQQGTNFAREAARRVARGAVIAQTDADCLPATDWLSKGVSALCHNNKARTAVTGPYNYFDADNFTKTFSLLSQQLVYPIVNQMVQWLGRGAILIGGNAFVRAGILEAAGGYNTSLTFYGDDVDLGKKLAQFGPVHYSASLTQRSSSRRYKANGFWKVNKKYQAYFWDLVWGRTNLLRTFEASHPR